MDLDDAPCTCYRLIELWLLVCELEDAAEYCMNEVFRARCAHDEVIVMKSALYGRMRLNRCITVDMGYLGCSANVLDLADARCSGRRECELRMPYPAFEATRPCYDLQSFFKASYYCLKGSHFCVYFTINPKVQNADMQ